MSERVNVDETRWEPSAEDLAVTEKLLASDDELERAYGEAYKARCFVKEWEGPNGTPMVAVGEMDALARIEKEHGIEVNPQELSMGDCVNLAFPGRGKTRAECVRDGLRQVEEYRNKDRDPNEPILHGSFNEKGYLFQAFMPANSNQPRQWTVKVYKEGEEALLRVKTISMLYEPIFGPDAGDVATLESEVDKLIKELPEIK